jgi:glycosyltransferase involved in cell wall biosynthesis
MSCLLVVTPAYNEGAHLDAVARGMAAQRRQPDTWLIVDDGSTDDTLEIARRWERELPFLRVISMPQPAAGATADPLALAKEARAVNHGLRLAGWEDFDYIGKLDADVELPPQWFEVLVDHLDRDASLGLLGGRLAEPSGSEQHIIPIPDSHVHGAVKLYRRQCLTAIGGIAETLGWDTIDEIRARMVGYRTQSLPGLVALHLRPWGSASGLLRGRARHGECAWITHQSVPWALLRALKLALAEPVIVSGLAFIYGYLRAAITGVPRVEDRSFRRFVRRELRSRVRNAITQLALARRATT